jgi:hypothetical protein
MSIEDGATVKAELSALPEPVRAEWEYQRALISAWADLPEDLPEEDRPHLHDILAAGMKAYRLAADLEALATAPGVSAGDLPGMERAIMDLAEEGGQ